MHYELAQGAAEYLDGLLTANAGSAKYGTLNAEEAYKKMESLLRENLIPKADVWDHIVGVKQEDLGEVPKANPIVLYSNLDGQKPDSKVVTITLMWPLFVKNEYVEEIKKWVAATIIKDSTLVTTVSETTLEPEELKNSETHTAVMIPHTQAKVVIDWIKDKDEKKTKEDLINYHIKQATKLVEGQKVANKKGEKKELNKKPAAKDLKPVSKKKPRAKSKIKKGDNADKTMSKA